MKKSAFLLGLFITTTICLTACNSQKNYEMTFDDALSIASHSELQDLLINYENHQQTLNISTNISNSGNLSIININSNSKQNAKNQSESSIDFDIKQKAEGNTTTINGNLNLKTVEDAIYMNLSSLNATGNDSATMIGMIAQSLQNQWYFIPMSGLSNVSGLFSYFEKSKNLTQKSKEIIINDGSQIYNGKFSQYSGYNARKFSLDDEKTSELIKEYYASMNNALGEIMTGESIATPEISIQNFEGYLIIVGKNKVVSIIENMDIIDDAITINTNGFGGDSYELNMFTEGQPFMTISAQKKKSDYDIYINLADEITIEGKITPNISNNKAKLKFDINLTIRSTYEGMADTTIPLEGQRFYEPIAEFNIETPTNAQNLTEIINAYLSSVYGNFDNMLPEGYNANIGTETNNETDVVETE